MRLIDACVLGIFAPGDTIPHPFPVGDYPSCPGLLDDAERENRALKRENRELKRELCDMLENEIRRLRREVELLKHRQRIFKL